MQGDSKAAVFLLFTGRVHAGRTAYPRPSSAIA